MAVALMGLVGCDQVSDRVTQSLSRIGAAPDATAEGIRTLALVDGAVRARGPEGYCIDQAASDARNGFAVQFGAVDTASIASTEEAFAEFLASDAGRSVLAADGDAASIESVATIVDQAGVLVWFEDTSGPTFNGTTGPQWRGFLDINGRLTTISVLSFERNVLSRAEGERLLVVAMAELAEANTTVTVATSDEEL